MSAVSSSTPQATPVRFVSRRRSRHLRAVAESARTDCVRPDWSRESCSRFSWQPARQVLRALRDYQRASGPLSALQRRICVLRHRFWSAVSGAEIPLNAGRIGGGLLLLHPNGIVIHPDVQLGVNCILFQQVTLGTGPRPGVPRLGHYVEIGPGAKVLGGVTVGDHAVIGANAVVIHDVPARTVVAGIPAVVKHSLDRDCTAPRD